jgi:hypothetical protein
VTTLADHSDALEELLEEATLGNCLEIARRLVALAEELQLPGRQRMRSNLYE